jgi:hypothetical protein
MGWCYGLAALRGCRSAIKVLIKVLIKRPRIFRFLYQGVDPTPLATGSHTVVWTTRILVC